MFIVENPNSPPSCLQTNPHSKKNGKRQEVFQGKRTSFSGVEHEKFSSSFSPPSTTPPSYCSASSLSITLARDGWWWRSKSPQNPPRFPKKTYARRHKKILSPSKLAVSILFSSSSCDLSNSLFLTKLKNRPKQSAEKNIQRLSKKSLDIKKEILVNLKTAIIE